MFDFVHNRRWFYLLSACLIIPGVISMILPGGFHPGIEFTSGTIMTIQLGQDTTQEQVRAAFNQLGHPEAIIQKSSNQDQWIIRTKPLEQFQQTDQGAQSSERQTIQSTLAQDFTSADILSLDQISPLIAEEIVRDAILAVVAASVFILLYLAYAFRRVTNPWRYGSTAIIALLHDALVVLGIFSILGRLFNIEIESTFIVAVLTVIGFSVHDTIVVFDRIRENYARHQGERFETVVNHSLAQTMTRSLNTSLTVLLTLVVMMLFGGETIRSFVLALLIGITTGTYSSIFVASMLLVSWQRGDLDWLTFWRRGNPRPNQGVAAA